MLADVSGIWEGTLETETAPAYAAYGGRYGPPLEIRSSVGGRKTSFDVTLTIDSQAPYRSFGTGPLVSRITGQLDSDSGFANLLAGFVDDTGLVKFSAYESAFFDSAFTGRLSPHGGLREFAGTWASRRGSLEDYWVTYSFGTLRVRKFGRQVRDSVFRSESRHVF